MDNSQTARKRYVTIIGSACLAIILGALGSAVWELVLHPTARRGWLTVSELAARYSMQYQEKIIWIAANDPYSISFTTFLVYCAGGVLALIAEQWRKIIHIGLRIRKMQDTGDGDDTDDGDTITATNEEGIRGFLKRRPLKQLFVILVSFGTVLTGLGFWAVFQLSAVGAATSLARNFNVSMQVCEPYIEHDALIRLRSRFATMRTWADYQALAQDVNAISDKYGVPLPSHSPSKR